MPCCVRLVPAGGSFTNTGSVGCLAVTTSSISVTNSASGTIGPAGVTPLTVRSSGTLTGGITNSGTILSAATGGTSVAAVGIEGYVQGGITNSGTISVASTGALYNYGAISVGTLFGTASATSFGGGITNSGTLSVTATGVNAADVMRVNVSTFSGDIDNTGTITGSATASASGDVTLYGLDVTASTFAGNILNGGMIAVDATAAYGSATVYGISLSGSLFSGSLSNGGTISASGTAGVTSGAAANVTGLIVTAGTFAGPIVNSGKIIASASATACCGVAAARGLAITSAVAFGTNRAGGGIVNTGTIVGTATITSGICCGSAVARGVSVSLSTFTGGITNSGSIIATAMVMSGAGSSNTAKATGLYVSASTFIGSIVNSGLISASATVNACGTAIARGISILANNTFAGGITNSGTIIAQATGNANRWCGNAIGILVSGAGFTGNIVNSGTIAGLVNVSDGYGVGIAVASGAHATITNSGLVEGSVYGIDLSNEGAASVINQTGGTIASLGCCGAAINLSSNADTVNISGGTIDGNIQGGGTANIVNVNMGSGTFSYAGSILNVGTVNLNSGTLLLQNLTAPGVSTLNYNQAAGSTLALEVQNLNNHAASLTASGTISLASGSTFQAFEGAFAWTPGTYTYAGVVAGGAITGSFTSITSNSPFFTASLTQGGTSDDLTLTMLSPSQVPGLNGNQKSVSNAIIGIPGGNGTLDQIFELNSAQLNTALTQLSGSQYTATNYQPLVDAWQSFTQTLSNRLAMGEGYGGTMTASYDAEHGIQFAQADIPQVAQMSDAGRGGAPSMPHQWGAWMRGYGLTSDAQATATSAAFRESGAGIIAGADNQITDRLVAGVAVNISTDKANVSGGGFTETNAYQGSVYGQYQIDPAWYVNGVAGFGWQTYKSARVVTLLTTTTNNGSYEGQSYRLYGESGYNLRPAFLAPNALQVTPYLGFGYLHTHTGGFTENGPTALNVQAMDEDSFATTLGARAALTWKIGATLFHPEIRAGWQHEWLDTAGTVTAAFAQAPGSVFTATGTGFGRDSFVGGAGMTTSITSSTQLFIDYDAKANSGYTAQVISGGMRVQF